VPGMMPKPFRPGMGMMAEKRDNAVSVNAQGGR